MPEQWVELGALVRVITYPAVVVEFRDDELHVVAANEAAAVAFGSPLDSILGTGFAAAYRPDELAEVSRRVREVIETKLPASHELVRELPTNRFVIESWLTPLPDDQVLGIGRDVSTRSAAIERATELESLTNTGTWVWNLIADSVQWSAELRRVFDLPEDLEPSLEAVFERIHPEDLDAVRRIFEEVRDSGRRMETEYRIRCRDGSERRIVARAGLARDDDGVAVRLFGTVQDVTEQRRLERQEERAAAASRQLDRALQLNDDVVQCLARAALALQLGRTDEVQAAVQEGTDTVRAIMSELLRSTTAFGGGLRSGDLRRRRDAHDLAPSDEDTRER